MAEMAPGADLPAIVQKHVDEGYIFMHPFDDPKLFGGYGVWVTYHIVKVSLYTRWLAQLSPQLNALADNEILGIMCQYT